MKEISATKFKEQCLAILGKVDQDGLVITRRGKPVAMFIPIRAASADLLGSPNDKFEIKGDVISTRSVWDAQS